MWKNTQFLILRCMVGDSDKGNRVLAEGQIFKLIEQNVIQQCLHKYVVSWCSSNLPMHFKGGVVVNGAGTTKYQ